MIFRETVLPGVFLVELEPVRDERGFFARTWCQKEASSRGLDARCVQCSVSFNTRKGTLRGMHYQVAPFTETKLVRCTSGAIYDVVLDLRRESPAFKKWTAAVLSARNRSMMYVPVGCARGFLTLEDESEVSYQMSEVYDAASAQGVRWDDPAFQIVWPQEIEVISQRDRTYPDFI
jgi:dTDP-4-dehydrorhamnose 3,5-epimerase